MNDQVKVAVLLQGRFADRCDLVDLQFVRLFRGVSSVKREARIYAVRTSRERRDWPVLSGPWRADVKTAVRLVTSPHVPFYEQRK